MFFVNLMEWNLQNMKIQLKLHQNGKIINLNFNNDNNNNNDSNSQNSVKQWNLFLSYLQYDSSFLVDGNNTSKLTSRQNYFVNLLINDEDNNMFFKWFDI